MTVEGKQDGRGDSFRFVDTGLLLENETGSFCVSFFKHLTYADETIWFGR